MTDAAPTAREESLLDSLHEVDRRLAAHGHPEDRIRFARLHVEAAMNGTAKPISRHSAASPEPVKPVTTTTSWTEEYDALSVEFSFVPVYREDKIDGSDEASISWAEATRLLDEILRLRTGLNPA